MTEHSLPIGGRPRDRHGDSAAGGTAGRHATNHRILVVDDDEELLGFLARLLRRPGREVLATARPSVARQLLARAPFSLVISDLHLTGAKEGEGLDLLAFVRAHAPATKTLLLTGDPRSEFRQRAGQLGVEGVLTKPLSALQFASDVLRLLEDG